MARNMSSRQNIASRSFRELYMWTDEAIEESFDGRSVKRGYDYFAEDRVLDIALDRSRECVTARVHGSGKNIYQTRLTMDQDDGLIFGTCTCPVEFQCKHAAAVAFYISEMQSPSEEKGSVPSKITSWLKELATVSARASKTSEPKKTGSEYFFFALDQESWRLNAPITLHACISKRLKNGSLGKPSNCDLYRLAHGDYGDLTDQDRMIAQVTYALCGSYTSATSYLPQTRSALVPFLIEQVVGSGHCHWKSPTNPPLKMGSTRPANVSWITLPDGHQAMTVLSSDSNTRVLLGTPLFYIDESTWTIGSLDTGLDDELLHLYMSAPSIPPKHAASVSSALQAISKNGCPLPALPRDVEVRQGKATPVLTLGACDMVTDDDDPAARETVKLSFNYGEDADFLPSTRFLESRKQIGDKEIITNRDIGFEANCKAMLRECGFRRNDLHDDDLLESYYDFWTDNAYFWLRFMKLEVPKLRKAGWQVDVQSGFSLEPAEVKKKWESHVIARKNGWFTIELGIECDGIKVSLIPLLMSALRSHSIKKLDAVDDFTIDGDFYVQLPNGKYAGIAAERVKLVMGTLLDLLNKPQKDLIECNVSLTQAMSFVQADPTAKLTGDAPRLKEIAEKLTQFKGVSKVEAPEGLLTKLRDYQLEGLSWLQFLREFNLGGVLADDMGLGKTVQTLAHVLIEKESGRMQAPCLIVAPTSVLPNWVSEANRLAPSLQVLKLHGPDRHSYFNEVSKADIVLTTYPLLLKDGDELGRKTWHMVVLDEAQAIKNPATKVAKILSNFNASHRLCLTGTPLENHLGELWSQFNFLLPGALGDQGEFKEHFRIPIERSGNKEMQRLLSARVRPFMLRRTKNEVAKELPEKTVILKRIELEPQQGDLYESIRAATFQKVQNEIGRKGWSRCQIEILDALLKLRQVCCDPRLVKLSAAQNVESSAKLDTLIEMLQELIDEGRRILLFSQFTSMLDLIEPELVRLRIPFVQIRGDTKDRATPVKRFQAGDVPLFLLSLKAGGSGLNLTAADTVIHYDPWWNPAVEDQATDRAHRIGQSKNVFVYKLIASGTIEERMIEMQERKRVIAQSVFDHEGVGKVDFDEADLELLFSPMN